MRENPGFLHLDLERTKTQSDRGEALDVRAFSAAGVARACRALHAFRAREPLSVRALSKTNPVSSDWDRVLVPSASSAFHEIQPCFPRCVSGAGDVFLDERDPWEAQGCNASQVAQE